MVAGTRYGVLHWLLSVIGLLEEYSMSYTLAAVFTAASEEAEHAAHALPMPAHWFGIIALGALLFLLLITFAFRSVGTRHD